MTTKKALVDANARKVSAFTSKIQNLTRVAELTDAVIDIAESGAWRDYTFATGRETWREAELDYFLIAEGMRFEDAARVLAWNKRAKELTPMMDRNAGPDKRRPFEQAAKEWHRLNLDLMARAKDLGWPMNKAGTDLTTTPIPPRARTQAREGMSRDRVDARSRSARIPVARRRELDKLIEQLRTDLDTDERRYVTERLRSGVTSARRRNVTPKDELARWRADVNRIGRKPTVLAKHWGVTRQQAHRRLDRIGA